MTPHLHVNRAGEGPPVVLLHGLFGSGNNLGALARALQDKRTVYSVDLPNHGRSDWLEDASPAAMAACLGHWLDTQDLDRAAFAGHSLGGKVAMQLALSQPQRVRALVVADIAPVAYPPHHDSVFAALEAVAMAHCGSRRQAAELMAAHLDDDGVIQFLLSSLRRDGNGVYRWRFDLAGLRRDYAAVRAAPEAAGPYPGPALFIKGGASDYIRETHRERILVLFPRAELKVMPGCGHWLHAENPGLFNRLVQRFLEAQEA